MKLFRSTLNKNFIWNTMAIALPILPMYAAVISCELIKVLIGAALVNKGIWIKDITV